MRTVFSLTKDWHFSKSATPQRDGVRVNLPHTWNAEDGTDGGNDYYRGKCCYTKCINRCDLPQTDCYFLEICGANASADVYADEKHIAHHDGGYSTWRVDITKYLQNDTFTLAIVVDNGKSDTVYPQVADFTFYGGLYRPVQIICVPSSHFDLLYYGGTGIAVTPQLNGDSASISVETYLAPNVESARVRYTITDAAEKEIATQTADSHATLTIPQVHLWHGRRDPYLYTIRAELLDGETVQDTVTTRFGCRTFAIDAEKGFFLNGEPYPLHGVSRHQDKKGLGNALTAADHRADMALIAELGANTIRLAHYQHDSYFYDLCDEYGMIVWAEIPYISQHMPHARENTISQMKELIIQNYNHPSIVVWGLSNEITMQGDRDPDLLENHRLLNDLCHHLDPTRKTVVAAVSPCPTDSPYLAIPDVIAYNHYFGWYGGEVSENGKWFDAFHAAHPDMAIACSEYGAEALNWHTDTPMQGDYTEEYQAYYHEEMIKQLFSRPYLWATYVWNMFDFGADARAEGGEDGQNHKGLVTFDRHYKKDAFYAYKAWLSDEPFVHICGKRYQNRAGERTRVTVYSNLPAVELFVNGISQGEQQAADHFFRFDVALSATMELVAVAGKTKDVCTLHQVETFDERYRLRDAHAVLNWFDVTVREGYFSLHDKVGDLRRNPRAAKAVAPLLFASPKEAAGFSLTPQLQSMMDGFSLLRLCGMLGMFGKTPTKAELLALNQTLNQIPKA